MNNLCRFCISLSKQSVNVSLDVDMILLVVTNLNFPAAGPHNINISVKICVLSDITC